MGIPSSSKFLNIVELAGILDGQKRESVDPKASYARRELPAHPSSCHHPLFHLFFTVFSPPATATATAAILPLLGTANTGRQRHSLPAPCLLAMSVLLQSFAASRTIGTTNCCNSQDVVQADCSPESLTPNTDSVFGKEGRLVGQPHRMSVS